MDQDSNPSNNQLVQLILLPSRLTKQLDELALFLGRVSSLPSSFTRTNPVSTGTSLRLTAGGHFFHLHLELNWAAIQTLCLILEKQGQYSLLIMRFLPTYPASSGFWPHRPLRYERERNDCSQGIDNDKGQWSYHLPVTIITLMSWRLWVCFALKE